MILAQPVLAVPVDKMVVAQEPLVVAAADNCCLGQAYHY